MITLVCRGKRIGLTIEDAKILLRVAEKAGINAMTYIRFLARQDAQDAALILSMMDEKRYAPLMSGDPPGSLC